MHNIIYNGINSHTMGLLVINNTVAQTPERRIRTTRIPGKDGDVHEDTGEFEDITVPVDFGFLTDNVKDWQQKYREIKKWLLSRPCEKLIFTNNAGYFYRVKTVKINTPTRLVYLSGSFSANFICDPYCYLEEGAYQIIHQGKESYLVDCECNPKYIIKGEGVCNLTINGKTLEANVGGNIIIDSESGNAYREMTAGKIYANSDTSGCDFYDLRFIAGDNIVEITNGFAMDIVPNWRCL